jgi:hypothetical protein
MKILIFALKDWGERLWTELVLDNPKRDLNKNHRSPNRDSIRRPLEYERVLFSAPRCSSCDLHWNFPSKDACVTLEIEIVCDPSGSKTSWLRISGQLWKGHAIIAMSGMPRKEAGRHANRKISSRAIFSCEICGSYSDNYEECYYIECFALYPGSLPTFRKNVLPPSSGSKNKPSKQTASSLHLQGRRVSRTSD